MDNWDYKLTDGLFIYESQSIAEQHEDEQFRAQAGLVMVEGEEADDEQRWEDGDDERN